VYMKFRSLTEGSVRVDVTLFWNMTP